MPRDTKIGSGNVVAVVLGTAIAIVVQISVAWLCYDTVAMEMGWIRLTWGQFFVLSMAIKLMLADLRTPKGG